VKIIDDKKQATKNEQKLIICLMSFITLFLKTFVQSENFRNHPKQACSKATIIKDFHSDYSV